MDKEVSCTDDRYLNEQIPYFVHERTIARFERIIRRLIWVIIIMVVAFGGYIWYDKYSDNQFDTTDVIVDSEDGGNANYMGDYASGVINNGEGNSKEESKKE